MYDGEMSSNAGPIKYFKIGPNEYALVHYWPRDNEVGAFYQLGPTGAFKMIADIGDSIISCQ